MSRRKSRYEIKLLKLGIAAAVLGLIKTVLEIAKAITDWITQ